MQKIKVSAVSYLNTKPFLFGLEHTGMINDIELTLDTPSEVAKKLLTNRATIGLLPVAVIPEIKNAEIIGKYCIGCNGKVASVCIYSQVAIHELRTVYLDYQSRTSIELAKILLNNFWKVKPQLIAAFPGYENSIGEFAGGLIIGDRSLQLKNNFKYCYDLGKAWKELTGLPFVFACWVSNEKLAGEFIDSFNESLESGVNHVPEVAGQNASSYPGIDTLDYLSHKIQFRFSDMMEEGMKKFLSLMEERVGSATR